MPHAVIKVAVLLAVGVTQEGKRQVLDFSVRQSEPQEHWMEFLQSLADRGLCGVRLVISDKHEGLQAAVLTVLGEAPWQRCQYFLHRNAQAQVPAEDLKRSVVGDIRSIFDAPDRQEADRLLKQTVEKYRMISPLLAEWMQENLPEGLTVFAFPQSHRRLIRTTNALERIHQDVRRRTRVSRLFPDEVSCERLVSAVAMKIDQEWATDKPYIIFNHE